MAYNTNANVLQLVGTKYSQSADLTTARVTAIIAAVDETVDMRLYRYCYPFNATGDTPATPSIIQRIVQHWAGSQCLREIGMRDDNTELVAVSDLFREIGNELIAEVIKSQGHTERETTSSDSLTFASPTNDWDPDSDEAFLASTTPLSSGDPPHIFPETVKVTNSGYADMRLGTDFEVWFSPRWRKWVFRSKVTAFHDGTVSSPAVSYEWNYMRDYAAGVRPSGVLVG